MGNGHDDEVEVMVALGPVVWTDTAAATRALGPSVDTADPYLGDCVDAANDWAWRKRQEAGYRDDTPDVAPSLDVRLGVTMYACALFRERGSADSFASFDELGTFVPTGTMGQINRLLGIGRGRVDTPLDLTVNPLVRHPTSRGRAWVP